MAHVGWRFPPLSGGTRQGYTNNDIQAFKGQKLIDNLTREICQNSLDARLEQVAGQKSEPVKVVFELKKIERKLYDVFSQYSECIKGCYDYWGTEMDAKLSSFLAGAKIALQEEHIPILIAGDYNTKGLSGSRSKELSSAWEALTGSDGVSVKSDKNSGGSYGIGKNAPFACSSLSMVFYNTVDEDNESAFIGVARLATLLNSDGKPTQRVGKYQYNDDVNEIWNPIFGSDKNSFRDCFTRNERGTDVIIVGFTEQHDWMKNITKAVLKNFFVAIKEEKLIVELKDGLEKQVIDGNTISQFFDDLGAYKDMVKTSELYEAFTNPGFHETFSVLQDNDVEVYIKIDNDFKRTIANFRGSGMFVGSYYKMILQHYAVVVIIRGQELGELLRATEPPKHDEWDVDQIEYSNKPKRDKASNSIKVIKDTVFKFLKSQCKNQGEDIVDAAGVGEYIPDDEDKGVANQPGGDDILMKKNVIGKISVGSNRQKTVTQPGVVAEGKEEEGKVHNKKKNAQNRSHKSYSRPVSNNPTGNNLKRGAMPGKGSKTLITPDLIKRRAFPDSTKPGQYRIVIIPSKAYNDLYIECSALGEDGSKDSLEIASFTNNTAAIKFDKSKVGPLTVQANTPAVFFVTFVNQEKMTLNLELTEGN